MIKKWLTKGWLILVTLTPLSCELFDRPEKKPDVPAESEDTTAVIQIKNDTIYYDISYFQKAGNTYTCLVSFSSNEDFDKVYVNVCGTLSVNSTSSFKGNYDVMLKFRDGKASFRHSFALDEDDPPTLRNTSLNGDFVCYYDGQKDRNITLIKTTKCNGKLDVYYQDKKNTETKSYHDDRISLDFSDSLYIYNDYSFTYSVPDEYRGSPVTVSCDDENVMISGNSVTAKRPGIYRLRATVNLDDIYLLYNEKEFMVCNRAKITFAFMLKDPNGSSTYGNSKLVAIYNGEGDTAIDMKFLAIAQKRGDYHYKWLYEQENIPLTTGTCIDVFDYDSLYGFVKKHFNQHYACEIYIKKGKCDVLEYDYSNITANMASAGQNVSITIIEN